MSEAQDKKMWSGRFREPLDRTFEQWQRSFPIDWRLLPQEVAASAAHARMIAEADVLTPDELERTLRGLEAVGLRAENWAHRISATSGESEYQTTTQQIAAGIVASAPQAEDIHHYVELELTREIGTLALKLHTGRSRNEQIATDMRLFVRNSLDETLAGLERWIGSLLEVAAAVGENVMPSYTHLQRAEPVLIAHWLLAYVTMLERDCSRLRDARARMNLCPLGSGAVAGATLALNRTIASEALGFDEPTPNSMDATSDRDFALEFTQTLATIGIHISRFAEELTLYSTAEFGFIDLPERFSTGSSAMPQKKNPDFTELIRGKCGRLVGDSVTLMTILKGLPLAYNKDLQEGQEAIFDAADTMGGVLNVLPSFTHSLKFRFDVMESAATTGYLNAMAAATYLTHKQVPFRKAHEIVGNVVRFAIERSVELDSLSLEELRLFSPEFGEDFFSSISLRATIDCHDVIGGTATNRVMHAIAAAKERATKQASARDLPSLEDSRV